MKDEKRQVIFWFYSSFILHPSPSLLPSRRGPRMTRATIDLGIDLGTTNSCIGLLKGAEVEILRNNDGQECTPSAVWIDRKDRLHVGQRAKEQYEADEENACIEFKLQMGKSNARSFQRGGRSF